MKKTIFYPSSYWFFQNRLFLPYSVFWHYSASILTISISFLTLFLGIPLYPSSPSPSPSSLSISIATQDFEMSNGWPLGLDIMNMRLELVEDSQTATAEPRSICLPSTSFSSFSSSNLDTQSSASFFQDHSVSLGRLIGIKAGDRGGVLYFPNRIHCDEDENESEEKTPLRGRSGLENSTQGVCIPLLLTIRCKMSLNRNKDIKTKNSNEEN